MLFYVMSLLKGKHPDTSEVMVILDLTPNTGTPTGYKTVLTCKEIVTKHIYVGSLTFRQISLIRGFS
jgi:hypothetical protein